MCAGYPWGAPEDAPEAAETGAGGRGRGSKEDMGAAGGSPAEAEATGRVKSELGM